MIMLFNLAALSVLLLRCVSMEALRHCLPLPLLCIAQVPLSFEMPRVPKLGERLLCNRCGFDIPYCVFGCVLTVLFSSDKIDCIETV